MTTIAPSSVQDVHILSTGVANVASVLAAFHRQGVTPHLIQTPEAVRDADHVVLPGVGSFGAGASKLRELGVDEALRARIQAGRPTLSICLGLQLLCASSDETPGVEGLGLIDAHVHRFDDTVRVPQLGWNRVVPTAGCALLEEGYAYYANSYRLDAIPEGWSGATSEHGGSFVAALERGAVLACQFHPELSGQWGAALLARWLAT